MLKSFWIGALVCVAGAADVLEVGPNGRIAPMHRTDATLGEPSRVDDNVLPVRSVTGKAGIEHGLNIRGVPRKSEIEGADEALPVRSVTRKAGIERRLGIRGVPRKAEIEGADEALPIRSVKRLAAAPQVTEHSAPPPRTAILLIGQMRGFANNSMPGLFREPIANFDDDRVEDRLGTDVDDLFIENHLGADLRVSFNEWLLHFTQGIVKPNQADVFIHAETIPHELVEGLGTSLKSYTASGFVDGRAAVRKDRVCIRASQCQLYHLKKAWELMDKFEKSNGIVYNVVIKTRSELAPLTPSSTLDLAGWQTPGRIHMLTDMIYWGQRQDMAHVAGIFDALTTYKYYAKEVDLKKRPINVRVLLDSLQRHRNTINKLTMLPYPDMGRFGAIANLKAAADSGLDICDGTVCKGKCGDKGSCTHTCFSPERDILDWVISNGLTVCDLGSKANQVYWSKLSQSSKHVMNRPRANDCGENEWVPDLKAKVKLHQ